MAHQSFPDARIFADQLIALIDDALTGQVNAILHHPDFQAMEARWRGLAMVVREAGRGADVKVKLLNASWRDLARNTERATDFDQSHLFEVVYNREFGMPGGEPVGLLIGDYAFSPDDLQGADSITTLSQIGMVAAAAFCPFVAAAAPSAVGLQNFSELSRVHDFSSLKQDKSRLRWHALRARDDSRFVGLVAPRVLMRSPYRPYARGRDDGFPFREHVAESGETLLWGNAAFAFATVVVRNFVDSGWFADLRGVTQDAVDGGMLSSRQLPPLDLGIESNGLSAQPPVEVQLTTGQEQQFSDLGIVPVSTTYLSGMAIFNANQSLHAPGHYSSEAARQNARLAAMLQYVLCASRFSHYLKVIMRDDIGQLSDASTIERKLEGWLSSYTLGNDDAEAALRTRYPLRSAGIKVFEVPGKPGTFSCTVRLQPHFQLDDVSTSFHLIAETMMPPAAASRSSAEPQRISA
ncbi:MULTISPECIES: type VI secretion system contractile sheath large subunit [Agrobacterium]|uniref:Type VI secretion system contractile sheath large subunit n=1 Tax=Agrobacterium salinitolerans TaxID=1183413 RepID=A0A4Z1R273_9HYPH|nr:MULTISPECIES: type VI secretion system contractile sheath large subunit [Agrobacterium]MCZ7865611.1 type VI secretion system contractile sheath large subunit [Agrobacterium salinitolerans]MDA5639462.1 type VI secretion system contractile sheath large subunit [Agrobacterium sp. ST15.13.013]MDA6999423.1 type VI secretion system contractile sheath large subunit [Agrobacterium salinitolerans]QXC49279.1 type VI secretion system contractile sheath large subunit [Agrobacterium salinitolerans]UYZ09